MTLALWNCAHSAQSSGITHHGLVDASWFGFSRLRQDAIFFHMATKGATILGTNPDDPIYPLDLYEGDSMRGGPAFTLHRGLTKREHFAGLAMGALLGNGVAFYGGSEVRVGTRSKGDICSEWALGFADDLIKRLNQEIPK